MAVMGGSNAESNAAELKLKIAKIQNKIDLTNSPEQKAILTDELDKLKIKLRDVNRKAPKIVPVKDAATIGSRKEYEANNHSSFLGNRVII